MKHFDPALLRHVLPLCSTGRFLLIFSGIIFSVGLSFSQPANGASFSASNSSGSDYSIGLSWTYNGSYCDCSQTTNLNVTATQSGGNNLPSNFLGSNLAGGSSSYLCGPGQSLDFDWTFNYSGQRQWTGDGCSVFATCIASCNCNYNFSGNDVTSSTAALKAPSSVSATDGDFDTKIVITWAHQSNVPDNLRQYRIYRNTNILVATVGGSITSYEHTGLTPGTTHTYTVKTYTPAGSFGIAHESAGTSDQGSTFDVGLVASDGAFYNRTKLSWTDISDICDEIRLERSIPGTANKEEIAIVSNNATAYNDADGIPGYSYTYSITPISSANNFLTDTDAGYSKPNGKISGHVKSLLNAGVSGVDINVELITTIPSGGVGLPTCTQTYCAVTDAEGYYEIRDIYYYTGADFKVKASKTGTVTHDFTPDSISRTLDVNTKTAAGVDFTDLTVFTAGGRVTYPESSNGATCGIKNVTILLGGENFGILTDANGDWTFAIQEEGTYSFTPQYLHHDFEDGDGDPTTTLLITADNTGIDFTDVETDDLKIVVQGGCEASLGDSVEVHVTAPNACFSEFYVTDVNGLLLIEDLPARDYSVMVTDIFSPGNPNISNILDQIGNIPVVIDLTVRDTATTYIENDTVIITPETITTLPNDSIIVTPADTMETTLFDTISGDVAPIVQFIYRSPLVITTDFESAGAVISDCQNTAGDNIILMEQGVNYVVQFEVKELLGADCYIDTGFLKIYDFVSDRGGTAVKIPIKGGIATYVINAGEPVVASNPTFHNHEKLLYIIPEVDLLDPEPVEYWVFVTGAKSNTPSFITRTPEIPMVILHDPPGDGSYSFIEKGTSYTSFMTNEVLVGGDAGFYLNLLLGAKVLTPFSGNGFGTQIKFEASAGRDNFNRDGIYTTVTFNERFSTSSLENLAGHHGDVYIGAAFNQEFSLSELLTFDADSCKGDIDIVPSIAVEDFATTFVYTEKHIRNTLLPTLGFIKNNILDGNAFSSLSAENQIEVNNLIADSLMWRNILNKNAIDRDSLALFKENISFSAGAPISREYSDDTVTMVSYEYNRFVNTTFALGAKIDNESGIWFDSELGVMGNFRFASAVNEGDDTTTTRTVGYVFEDNDIGDFFSVDILQDVAYNVPAFRLKLGTTSCPQEAGSQARDRATIQVLPPEVNNVPAGGTANFVCQLTNISESFETREYGVRVISTSNPDGANVILGGQWISGAEATFFLAHNQTLNMNLAVQAGPLASNYENIAIMIYPLCEYALWQDNGDIMNGDTAYIVRVNFESLCTDVSLHQPEDGWLVNNNDNDQLHVAFTGYDLNNPMLQSLSIQVKREGEGYVDMVTVDKDSIIGPFYDHFLDVSNLEDGNYRIRAKANCGIGGGISYSTEKLGIIDRASLAPFGTPTPSDGFLREGQEVSVTFDKIVNCSTGSFSLIREDTDAAIPFTTSCFNNKIIFNTTPALIDQLSLDGVLVTARVEELEDLSGNVQEYPTQWSFLVNVSPVFWDPENLYASGYEGETNTFEGVLKNTSVLSKAFSLATEDAPSLIEYPEWLTPVQTRGTILPENEFRVEFAVDADLLPGVYTGVVVAMVDSLPVSMNVTYELFAKPVNWPFSPDGYQYTMTVVAQFSTDNGNINLSTDTRDLVGAFVNGQIRGVTNLVYIPELNVYRAFLTVHSNVQGGGGAETVRFRFWKALTGVEYTAVETTTFTLDNTLGTVTTPYILHPQGFLQVIPLNQGWNWISLNLSSANMSRENIFQSILNTTPNNTITVKSKSQTTTYTPPAGWSGNLSSLQLGAGYLVHLSNGLDTLRVPGLPSATTISVSVLGNWNWIGFPRLAPEPVNDVLEDLNNAVTGNILKSQNQFASFNQPTDSWLGNLNFFSPGEGYKLFLTNPGIIFFAPSRNDGYETDPNLYEYNMNINGMADLDIIGERHEEDLIVGAFIDGVCRGTGTFEFNSVLGEWRVVMLVNGNVDDLDKPIVFKFKNENTGDEYISNGQQLAFVADGIVGSIISPYDFFHLSTAVEEGNADGYHLEQSKPNPTKGIAQIGFQVPTSGKVTITVYDVTGNEIMKPVDSEMSAGKHIINLDLRALPKGMYFYELMTNDFSATKKLVKE